MLQSSTYNILIPLRHTSETVLVNGISGAIDVVANHIAALLQQGEEKEPSDCATLLDKRATDYLVARGYLTPLSAEEERERARAEARRREADEISRPRKFYLIPTYDCQLRCSYCFEHEVRSQGRREGWARAQVQPKVVEAAFSAMKAIAPESSSGGLCTLFGGEALQADTRATIEEVVGIARQCGFSLMAATNAFDLHLYRDLLGPGKIAAVHVPVDGTEATHDRLRVAKGGAPTFRRIIDNLKMALECGVRVRMRVNVNASALDQLDALADLLVAHGFAKHPRFSCYVKAIFATKRDSLQPQHVLLSSSLRERLQQDLSGRAATRIGRHLITDGDVADKISSSDRLARMFSGYPVIHDRIDSLFASRPENALRPSHCGTSSLQILVFDPLGRIYPCNNVVGRPEHSIGTFYPTLEWNQPRAQIWRERTVGRMAAVGQCKYALFCGGGCAFDGLIAYGAIESKSCDCDDFARTFAGFVSASYRRIVTRPELKLD